MSRNWIVNRFSFWFNFNQNWFILERLSWTIWIRPLPYKLNGCIRTCLKWSLIWFFKLGLEDRNILLNISFWLVLINFVHRLHSALLSICKWCCCPRCLKLSSLLFPAERASFTFNTPRQVFSFVKKLCRITISALTSFNYLGMHRACDAQTIIWFYHILVNFVLWRNLLLYGWPFVLIWISFCWKFAIILNWRLLIVTHESILILLVLAGSSCLRFWSI